MQLRTKINNRDAPPSEAREAERSEAISFRAGSLEASPRRPERAKLLAQAKRWEEEGVIWIVT